MPISEIEKLSPAPAGKTGWPWTRPGGKPAFHRGKAPRITVITPSLNQAKYLEETLRSVLLQGYPDLEYIVVDGGSTDGSVEILERYASALDYWVSEPDRGQAHAINKGLERATGEIVGWLNSDDLLLPGSLERIAARFVRAPEVMVVAGLRKVIDARGAPLRNWVRDPPIARYLRRYCCVAQETVYWRREVSDRLGLLAESFEYALDYEYWLRMLDAGYELTQVPHYLAAVREHPESKSANLHDVYREERRRLCRRQGLGRDEEDVLAQLGEEWPHRLALLEDLCETRCFDRPRLAVAFLRLLERPRVSSRIVSLYRRYRAHRPRHTRTAARWRAVVATGLGELRRAPLPGAFEPHLARANPLDRPRLCCRDAAEVGVEELTADGLRVGEGWSWIERSADRVYRWADNDAEILVTRPTGLRRKLVIEIESGPSLGWQALPLEILDEEGRALDRRTVAPRDVVRIELPLAPGRPYRCIRLRVPSEDRPASPEDSRILNFRLTWLGFEESGSLYDLPLGGGRTAQIALEPRDIVPPEGVRRLRALRPGLDLPAGGLFVGGGWLPPETHGGKLFRRAPCGCEIVVTAPARPAAGLRILAEPLDDDSSVLRLVAEDGRPIAEQELPADGGPALLELPLEVDRPEVFRLEAGSALDARPARGWRVFRLGWR